MIDEITFLPSTRSQSQNALFSRACKGLKELGVNASVRHYGSGTKAVACWGWRKGQELKKQGHDVLVFERAYLGDRFSWTSIAWNGLNARGDFCLPKVITPERFERNFQPLAPWKEDGDYILIMGQVPGDMSLQGLDLTCFYEDIAQQLTAHYGMPVYYRPHLHGRTNFKPRVPLMEGDLETAIAGAFLVVTYNSNSGVDAVVRGVPALSYDKGSMAWEVTGHAVDAIIRPDRAAWAHRLAHCQWTPEEIDRGDYWERMSVYR